ENVGREFLPGRHVRNAESQVSELGHAGHGISFFRGTFAVAAMTWGKPPITLPALASIGTCEERKKPRRRQPAKCHGAMALSSAGQRRRLGAEEGLCLRTGPITQAP